MALTQTQKIGQSKGSRRICLWNKAMIECGFPIGQPIEIGFELDITTGDEFLFIRCQAPQFARKKVSRVVNHGNILPVIDMKENKSLDLSPLGNIGDTVTVEIKDGEIRITALNG